MAFSGALLNTGQAHGVGDFPSQCFWCLEKLVSGRNSILMLAEWLASDSSSMAGVRSDF